MVGGALREYVERVRRELRKAFAESHSPHEVAGSFALGIFITALPSLGFGLVAFLGIVALSARVSKVAIFSSVAVLNPAFKPGVYYVSYRVGDLLVGAERQVFFGVELLDEITDLALRFVLGNVLVGLLLAALGYAVVRHFTEEYRRRHGAPTVTDTEPPTAGSDD